jgi:ABC-type branched-subunit amino acid transport system ATPase component/ABC-type branched-subunit amino acid transport system permease subunit
VVVGGAPAEALGPSLLLRALAAAMVGRMTSLPKAMVGGVAVGVIEAVFFANVANPGAVDLALFLGVLALVLRSKALFQDETGSWSLTPKVRAIPEALRTNWLAAHLNFVAGLGGLAIAIAAPVLLSTSSQTFQLTRVLVFALIGLSVTVLTGWTGQLSLGQFAFVGLGAVVANSMVGRGISFPVALVYAGVAGGLAALIVGFPALRVRGPLLAVTSLAFAVVAQTWLLGRSVFQGPHGIALLELPRTKIFGIFDLHVERTYYFLCLVILTLAILGVGRLRATGAGRAVIAVRENEPAAASFSVSPALTKLGAFAFSGVLAGVGGGLLAGAMVQFQVNPGGGQAPFSPQHSLQIVAMVVIGGLGSVGGAVLGAVYLIGLPALFGSSNAVSLAVSGIGLLTLLLYLPGGLMQVPYRARDAILGMLARRSGSSVELARSRAMPLNRTRVERQHSPDVPALVADAITVSFGGRRALDSVHVTAWPREVVGLIGSNGAGKSTLMNVIGGYIQPSAGKVSVRGEDISGLLPHQRARLGFGRVFQDARLFGDLTVRETVKVALEAHERSEFVPSLLALGPSLRAERAKSAAADACIDYLGLGHYADAFISDLSTGTRRIVELCCLLAQEADVLLLDEPTAGVAQRETEAFGPLIKRIQRELSATVLIIEHDIPLVMSMSDRVYCLAAGQCIAEGSPHDVRSDPAVVAAYLGTDERAIQRSGAVTRRGRVDRTARPRGGTESAFSGNGKSRTPAVATYGSNTHGKEPAR